MLKEKKQDIFNIIILCVLLLVIIGLFIPGNLFGSMKDWLSQHIQLADYFRTLFYDSGDIFPSFAFNLGAGENIYNISYYGLFNPIILISYLLPFVPMTVYIECSMVVIIIISIILLYKFLRKSYSPLTSFLGTFIFMTSSFLIFHAHRHIMFMNYFPFLLLALYGIDKYFEQNKKGLLIISIFLMILTSYYFSVVGILSVSLYGIYKCLKEKPDIKLKEFVKEALKYIGIIIIPILMAAFLLLPTVYVMLDGRAETNTEISILSLLLPSLNTEYLLYTAYTIGISAIGILAIIAGYFSQKKNNFVLAVILTVIFAFPIFNYICNGGMYLNGKAFIPLVPLLIILICEFFTSYQQDKAPLPFICTGALLLAILNIIYYQYEGTKEILLFILDMTVLVILILLASKRLVYIYVIIFSFVIALTSNFHDEYVTKETYDSFKYDETKNNVQEILKEDTSFYRMADQGIKIDKANHIYDAEYYTGSIYSSVENSAYKNFYSGLINNEFIYRNIFMLSSTDNIFYNFYLGNKYLLNMETDIAGYEKIKDNVYVNEDVMPVGYVTDKIMSGKEYNSLDKFERLDAYLNYAIIEDNKEKVYDKKVSDITSDYEVKSSSGISVEEKNGKYKIKAQKGNKLVLTTAEDMTDKILLLSFKMNYNNYCSKDDSYIKINGVLNKLTCQQWKYHNKNFEFEYSVTNPEEIVIKFSEGKFNISDIEVAVYDYNDLVELKESVLPFVIDRDKTKGDYIYGKVDNKTDGFFKLSIPYDKGFEIKVDGEEVSYQKVNKTFIGFPLKAGEHEIEITYTAPWLKEGQIISVIGLGLFILVLFRKRK